VETWSIITEGQEVSWNTQSLSVVAGVLRRDYPQLSAFELVRVVWNTASRLSPETGGIRLLACCRRAVLEILSADCSSG
jgi:hypothetical protein